MIFGGVVLAEVSVFKNCRQPWRTICQLFNLNRLFDDDAVRADPRASAHRDFNCFAVACIADVRLRVHGQRSLLPCRQLHANHLVERALRRLRIGEGAGIAAKVAFSPESDMHDVYEFDQRIAIEAVGEQAVQLGQRFLILGMIVARLNPIALRSARVASAGIAVLAHGAYRDHGNPRAEELGQCELLG